MKRRLFLCLTLSIILLTSFGSGVINGQRRELPNKTKTLELVFVIDTTGSMSGLIEGAKQSVWGIVNQVLQSEISQQVRVGLVAYRDRGDQYVTQVTPLTNDLDAIYTKLMGFKAEGGGDTPENVRRALADAVHQAGWASPSNGVVQIVFLVGDAPPHDDYQDEPDTKVTVEQAVRKNMIINTIRCGDSSETQVIWQQIAHMGTGKYFSIAQDGGVAVIQTPYDEKLSALSTKLGGTYLAYGDERRRVLNAERQAATEVVIIQGASITAQADRALNKAVNTNAYADDLLQALENGTVKLQDIKQEDLPTELQKLTPAERQKEIDKRLAERKLIRAEILELSQKRDQYLESESKKVKGKQGFENAVVEALKTQLVR
ncbi:MAG: vWA domain-containing protein [Acidobacteriota bacterium]